MRREYSTASGECVSCTLQDWRQALSMKERIYFCHVHNHVDIAFHEKAGRSQVDSFRHSKAGQN